MRKTELSPPERRSDERSRKGAESHANRRQAEVQGFSWAADWTAPGGVLGDLTNAAFQRAESVRPQLRNLRAAACDMPLPLSLAAALRGAFVSVIAEVKRASPSKGAIAPGLDAITRAAEYVAGGAAAISVLTEPSRFGGSLSDLRDVALRVSVPTIRKDFIVDAVQLWEARAAGAAAALLIVRALSPDLLPRLVQAATECGLEAIVEVRDLWELERAVNANALVIGVNNRNLETLVIDPSTAPSVIPSIPRDRIAVAESGMREPADVQLSAQAGCDAILVGGAVSAAASGEDAVRALCCIPRSPR
ncbi:MAG: indole-3-glycerol phosphate synthase TrpC [Gemmatimonas sp.]